jgi:WhiB family redox-sensing transcriptional regulator
MKEIDRLTPHPGYLRPWQDSAACRGDDSAWFFPAEAEQRRARLRREARAKAVCWQCPVMQLCRDHALRVEEPAGIWGALTEEERAQILLPSGPTPADALRR